MKSALSSALLFFVSTAAMHAQTALPNGENTTGSISVAGEIDSYTFSAAKDDNIVLRLSEVLPIGTDPGFRPWIRLLDPTGAQVGSRDGALAATIAIVAPLTGSYTVLVRDSTVNRPGSVLGNYVLRLAKMPGAFTVPVGDQGGPLTNGANHTGRIETGDLDMWTFTAAQNESILLRVTETRVGEVDPNFRPDIRLFGPNGALLEYDEGALAATVDLVAPLSGTYTVLISDSDFNREGSVPSDYVLRLAKMPGTFTVPSGDQGGELINGANHTGRIEVGDLDMWTFTAAQNESILLRVTETRVGEVDPNFRPDIRLFGPNGALLKYDEGALAATVDVVAPLSGTYTVLISDSDFNREGSVVSDYVLRLAKAPGTFSVPSGDQGGELTNGANHSGRIEVGDLDMWTFTASRNDSILIRLTELRVGEVDPNFRPDIRLFAPNGELLKYDDGALAATVETVAPLSGTYTVLVSDSDFNREGSVASDYVLRLAKIPGAFVVPAGDQGGAVSAGGVETGLIEPGDLDIWTFIATQNASLNVTVTEVIAGEVDPDFRPMVRLYGPDGVLVDWATGALTATVSRSAPLSGTYTVVVSDSDFNREGSVAANYRLAVTGASAPVPPTIATGPISQTVSIGGTATLSVNAIGTAPLAYQWRKDGIALTGATNATLTLSNLQAGDQGAYSVVVSNSVGSVTSNTATLVVITSRISNVSVRTTLAANQTLIVGMSMSGGPKSVLLRAVGPGLAQFGVPGTMPDPQMALFDGGTQIDANDNWGGGAALSAAFVSVGAFALPAASLDAALVRSIDGARTAQVRGAVAGGVLVEAYDAGTGNAPRLVNISARNRVGTGADILIAGFVVAGTGSKTVLIRAVGPTLAAFGVTGTLTDPKLEIYSGTTKINENDTWAASLAPTFTAVGAFQLTAGSRDAALVATLPAGAYTAQVSGADGGTGEALVEIYEVTP